MTTTITLPYDDALEAFESPDMLRSEDDLRDINILRALVREHGFSEPTVHAFFKGYGIDIDQEGDLQRYILIDLHLKDGMAEIGADESLTDDERQANMAALSEEWTEWMTLLDEHYEPVAAAA